MPIQNNGSTIDQRQHEKKKTKKDVSLNSRVPNVFLSWLLGHEVHLVLPSSCIGWFLMKTEGRVNTLTPHSIKMDKGKATIRFASHAWYAWTMQKRKKSWVECLFFPLSCWNYVPSLLICLCCLSKCGSGKLSTRWCNSAHPHTYTQTHTYTNTHLCKDIFLCFVDTIEFFLFVNAKKKRKESQRKGRVFLVETSLSVAQVWVAFAPRAHRQCTHGSWQARSMWRAGGKRPCLSRLDSIANERRALASYETVIPNWLLFHLLGRLGYAENLCPTRNSLSTCLAV